MCYMCKYLQMKLFITKTLFILIISMCNALSDPLVPDQPAQGPEVNIQLDKVIVSEEIQNKSDNTLIDGHNELLVEIDDFNQTNITANKDLGESIYKILSIPIENFLSSPKINTVLHNIGTCIVNGVMEIVSHYFPAPFIPLIASAAGMVIPFEPVVMLRRRMPVTSYRRAFETAVNGFMNTFDTYKVDSYDDDPYMTRRFNRRFMNDVSKENNKDKT